LGDLYTWMRIANPDDTEAFFTELKNLWLERNPNIYGGNHLTVQTISSTPVQPQSNKALELFAEIAQHLEYTGNMYNAKNVYSFVECELYNRLGGIEAYLAKLLKKNLSDIKFQPIIVMKSLEKE
jgi:hypothetical protein